MPVISVDTKKKELLGNYDNCGQQCNGFPQKAGQGQRSRLPFSGASARLSVWHLRSARNTDFVNVGTDHDTGSFAIASIRGWWQQEGRLYGQARELYITADGGGSNGSRLRLWKLELQKFADETALSTSVSHFPPGTSKWNKVEHRLFSFISSNWRGEPLLDYATINSPRFFT